MLNANEDSGRQNGSIVTKDERGDVLAILKHIANKSSWYSGAELYLCFEHDAKTGKPLLDGYGFLVPRQGIRKDSIHCNFDSFAAECMEVNQRYQKNRNRADIKSHSYIISFSPEDNITVDDAMIMAKNFAYEFLEGHQTIIVVHPDGHNGSGNIHAHIVANSVRKVEATKKPWHEKDCEFKQGCKHKCTNAMLRAGKRWLMDRCRAWGLQQVDLFSSKVREDYWVRKRGLEKNMDFLSDKEKFRELLDIEIGLAKDFDDFISNLKLYSSECRVTNKTISFKNPGMKQAIRGKRLGDEYDKSQIEQRIAENGKKRGVVIPEEDASRTMTFASEDISVGIVENMKVVAKETDVYDSYISDQAYPEIAMEAEHSAVVEMQSVQKPLALELALKEFMKCHSDMDTEQLLDAFYKEYNKQWDDYYAKEEKRQIKTKIR